MPSSLRYFVALKSGSPRGADSSSESRRFGVILTVGIVLFGLVPGYADEPYGRFQFEPADRDHWSFVPVKRPEIPGGSALAPSETAIDAFLLAKLSESGLHRAPPVDRRTLLRRVYLDLIGLPPTPEEQLAFWEDDSPQAFEKVVDSLLARAEYGERWGRHWLDVARYAESNGYERDGAKPSVWRYRDYVLDAFAYDKPYDRFVIEQLAGDETDDSNAETQIATTFLRLGLWDDEPADPEVDRYDQLDDLVAATSSAFMAQSLRCARCHDHKFEKFSQRDYTRMLANFEPLQRPQDGRVDLDAPVGTHAEVTAYEVAMKAADVNAASVRAEGETFERELCRKLAQEGRFAEPASPPKTSDTPTADELPQGVATAFLAAPCERTPGQVDLVKKHRSLVRGRLAAAYPEETKRFDEFERKLEAIDAARPAKLPAAYIWREGEGVPPPTRLFRRGNPRDPQEEVAPGYPAILVDSAPPPPTKVGKTTGRRLSLARWLVQPEHPLTARVIVNRVWQHHFGDGIVGSENDFGVMGEAPSHPELLDWLASELLDSGWSLKRLQRSIILSNAYAMSAHSNADGERIDPRNRLLWRFPTRRLEAETIRDLVLATSGALEREKRGPSVYPTISPAVMASQSRPGTGWGKSEDAQADRRTIYAFVKRTLLIPELEVLDFPDTNGACEQRAVSTVAPQALTYLNGEFMRRQSIRFARRLLAEAKDEPARVELAFVLAFSRPPSEDELAAVSRFLATQRRQIASDASADEPAPEGVTPADWLEERAWTALALALTNANEFVYAF